MYGKYACVCTHIYPIPERFLFSTGSVNITGLKPWCCSSLFTSSHSTCSSCNTDRSQLRRKPNIFGWHEPDWDIPAAPGTAWKSTNKNRYRFWRGDYFPGRCWRPFLNPVAVDHYDGFGMGMPELFNRQKKVIRFPRRPLSTKLKDDTQATFWFCYNGESEGKYDFQNSNQQS